MADQGVELSQIVVTRWLNSSGEESVTVDCGDDENNLILLGMLEIARARLIASTVEYVNRADEE